jgi:hypothetical protein
MHIECLVVWIIALHDDREETIVNEELICLLDPVDLRGEAGPGEQVEREEQQHTEEEEERAETPTVEERQQAATTQTKRAPKAKSSSTADEELCKVKPQSHKNKVTVKKRTLSLFYGA